MVFKIPSSFRDNNRDYIIIPVLKKFLKEVGKRTSEDRLELIESIERFANENNDNYIKTLDWLDRTLKEGIKDIYVFDIELTQAQLVAYNDENTLNDFLCSIISPYENKYICICTHSNDLRIVKWCKYKIANKWVVSFTLTKLVFELDPISRNYNTIIYPIFIDIYINDEIVVGRAKPKSNLYEINDNALTEEGAFNYLHADSLSTGNLINEAKSIIIETMGVQLKSPNLEPNKYKRKFYRLLDKYTNTPKEIQDILNSNADFLNNLTNTLLERLSISNTIYIQDAKSDMLNMAEKYLSISCTDKGIFIRDRDAYPLKLKAKDEEESQIEEVSGYSEPLQSKAIFFDNKKMLKKTQECDGITFYFLRKNKQYHPYDYFYVILKSGSNNACIINIRVFCDEEDIQHVIQQIISA